MPGPWGGTEVHTVRLARTLKDRSHDAVVVCLTDETYAAYKAFAGDTIELRPQPIPKERRSMGLVDWVRLLRRQPLDTCVLVKGAFEVGSWKLDLAARLVYPTYLTIEHLTGDPIPTKTTRRHFGVVPGVGWWWYRDRLRRRARAVGPRKVMCVSDAVRRRLVEGYRFPPSKVVTVQNGVDVSRFRPDSVHGEAWRRRWGIDARAVAFGAMGRFAPMKGYNTALTAFQALLRRFPEEDLRLILVGEGPQEQVLRARASQIVPDGRIVFASFCDRPWEALCALDVFVMPSLNEGLPLTLLEAMACGCCPIATAVGGIPEVLSKPEVGWLVPAGDGQAFAEAMIDAATRTPAQRASIGASAREHIVKDFNAAVQFNLLVDEIERSSRVRPHPAPGRQI
jgi:glycosyltransferase involved in cell wall biosynthesis